MNQKRSDSAHKKVWAKFVQAVESRDFATTRALFDSGDLGGAYAWDEFRLAADSREQTTCLKHLGAEPIDGISIYTAESIEDFKEFKARGLDLKRTGHLVLQKVQQLPCVLHHTNIENVEISQSNPMS
jgi:hypothetical protein